MSNFNQNQSTNWSELRRVLIVRLDNIGDIVSLTASLRALRRQMPIAEITFLCTAAGEKVAPMLPWINRTIVKSVLWQDTKNSPDFTPGTERALIREIAAENFDAAFIFTSFSQSAYPPAYVCYLAGIPIRVAQSKEFGGAVLTHWVKSVPDRAHQAERSLHLLESVGIAVDNRNSELVITAEIRIGVDSTLNALGVGATDEFLILAPGATCPARRYSIERFAQVAEILIDEIKLPIVVVGSEKERRMFEPIFASKHPQIMSLVGDSSVVEMSAVIARARLVICNDSGPMHIADAFARPQVVMYSGTELESQWRPRASAHVLLNRPTPCTPCYLFECPFQMQCLDVPPLEVAETVLKLLANTAEPQNAKANLQIEPINGKTGFSIQTAA